MRWSISDPLWREEFSRCERAGMSARQIAEVFNVSARTVVRWRARTGFARGDTYTREPDEVRAQARRLVDGGASLSDAGETVGVTGRTVRRWFPDVPGWTKSQAGAHTTNIPKRKKAVTAPERKEAA